MKLKEILIYSSVTFLASYVLLSVSLRILELTEQYFSHVIAGVIATILSIGLFMYLTVNRKKMKKKKKKSTE